MMTVFERNIVFIKKWDKNKSSHNDHIRNIMFTEKRDEKLEKSHHVSSIFTFEDLLC